LLAEFAGNTRVVNQKELEFFREELQNRMSSSYNVILKEKKVPLSLLNDRQKVCGLSEFEL
jgi:nuclear GTP-binding protein